MDVNSHVIWLPSVLVWTEITSDAKIVFSFIERHFRAQGICMHEASAIHKYAALSSTKKKQLENTLKHSLISFHSLSANAHIDYGLDRLLNPAFRPKNQQPWQQRHLTIGTPLCGQASNHCEGNQTLSLYSSPHSIYLARHSAHLNSHLVSQSLLSSAMQCVDHSPLQIVPASRAYGCRGQLRRHLAVAQFV